MQGQTTWKVCVRSRPPVTSWALASRRPGAALECQNLMTFWILSLKAFCSWSHLDISWHYWTCFHSLHFLRKVYGPETHITAIIPMALGLVDPLPEPDLSAPAGPPAWTWEELSISSYHVLSLSFSYILKHFKTCSSQLKKTRDSTWLNMTQVSRFQLQWFPPTSHSEKSRNYVHNVQKLRQGPQNDWPPREPSHKLTGCISVQMPWYAMTFQT